MPAGFDPDRVLTLLLSTPESDYRERDQVVRLFEQLLAGVRAAPGVVGAGAVAGLPLQAQRGDWDFYLEGETPGPHGSDRPADWQVVTPGYFETLGIRLAGGRFLSAADRAGAPAVALINETLARTFFPGRSPVGRQIRLSGPDRPWMTIVGVAGDVHQDGLDRPPVPEIYLPHAQFRPFWNDSALRTFTVVVRGSGGAAALAGAGAAAGARPRSELPIATVDHDGGGGGAVDGRAPDADDPARALRRGRAGARRGRRLRGAGVPGGRRRREIGMRLALGARPRQVLAWCCARA